MGRLLDGIDSPRDLKALPQAKLPELAAEIRRELVKTVSETGGHLAPNLGAVELTLALHRVFNAPQDKIIWDVGHQAYVHKLLTGRRERFATLRKPGGISGFPRRDESPYDAFGVGHGSTSISAALGFAVARDLEGRRHEVIAVIGDGALSGGLAFEGLNQIGERETDILIVLNDNGMSISPNVGAMSRYLQSFRLDPGYSQAKQTVQGLLRRYDRFGLGAQVLGALERIKDGAKHVFLPGMLFEDFGLHYVGPVDGHDLNELIETFGRVGALRGPRIVHVVTQKGRGYRHAEEDAESFHGCKPFDVPSGRRQRSSASRSYSRIFGEALTELAHGDNRIVAITAAMCVGTGLTAFAETHPTRFFDVGMAEEHAVTFAAGLAADGLKPVVAIYSTFLQRGYDQIIHDVCLQNLPVVFCLDRAGIVGSDGPTHHGVFDLAYLRHIPNLVVAAPKDGHELKAMLKLAARHDGPMAIRYPADPAPEPDGNGGPGALEVGRAEVLREGTDVALIAIGNCAYAAAGAARELAEVGIAAAVINARFAKPLDADCLAQWADTTGRVVTIEESVLAGGFGTAVMEMLAERDITAAIRRLGVPDEFVAQGSPEELRAQLGLDVAGITRTVREFIATSAPVA